jgi:hypothetical protein
MRRGWLPSGFSRRLVVLCRATGRVLLGLFVLWQLAFLALANLPGVETALRAAARRSDLAVNEGARSSNLPGAAAAGRWADWTAQRQAWQLFAPDLAEVIPFLVVVLAWKDNRDPLVLPSENEPPDRHRFFRLGRFRTRRAETALEVAPALTHDEPFEPRGPAWRDQLLSRVNGERVGFCSWLRWRVLGYLREHPDLPAPDEVQLHVRLFRIPWPPGPVPWDWEDLGRHPVLRCPRAALDRQEPWKLEVFDPVAGRFEKSPP